MVDVAASGLAKALMSADDGAVLRLAPGEYPKFRPKGMRPRRKPLTIVAADPASPPRFTEGLALENWSNVELRGCDFDISSATARHAVAVRIYGGEKITISGGRITGRLTPEGRWGHGLQASDVRGLVVRDVRASVLRRGFVIGDSEDVQIIRNDLVDLGSDGIDLGGVLRGEISANLISDFNPVGGDHADGIQLMAPRAQRGCRDIKVLRNAIVCGHVGRTRAQGVFVSCQNPAEHHAGLEIAENLLIDTNWNGVAAYGVRDILVRDNSLLFVPEVPLTPKGATKSWILLDEDCEGVATNNQAMQFSFGPKVKASGNKRIAGVKPAAADAALARWRATNRPAKAAPPPSRRSRFDDVRDDHVQLAGHTLFHRLTSG